MLPDNVSEWVLRARHARYIWLAQVQDLYVLRDADWFRRTSMSSIEGLTNPLLQAVACSARPRCWRACFMRDTRVVQSCTYMYQSAQTHTQTCTHISLYASARLILLVSDDFGRLVHGPHCACATANTCMRKSWHISREYFYVLLARGKYQLQNAITIFILL